MTRRRRKGAMGLGEAISVEDVLAMLAVIMVLRLVLMVPLVNIDRAKTVSALSDPFWTQHAAWILSHGRDSLDTAAPYRSAFPLEGRKVVARMDADSLRLLLEAADADNNILILEHDLKGGGFIAMNVQESGHAISFRFGRLLWSEVEKEWFSVGDSLDYGKRPESRRLENELRAFTKRNRGY